MAERFSLDVMVGRYLELYEDAGRSASLGAVADMTALAGEASAPE